MADAKSEVRTILGSLIANMQTLAEKNPNAPIESAYKEFNLVLRLAKEAYKESRAIQAMEQLPGSTSVADVMMKLSVLHGASGAHQ